MVADRSSISHALRKRAVATRSEKTAASFLGILYLAAVIDWLSS
jgi:hypothetical protein